MSISMTNLNNGRAFIISIAPMELINAMNVNSVRRSLGHHTLANAIYDAVGVRFNHLPVTPKKIVLKLKKLRRAVEKSMETKS